LLIKGIITRFSRSEFLKNTTILSSGTAIAQAISIITAPVLTRIYFPQDYGILGIYMIFCALINTLSTMQYQNAIITAETDEAAQDVLQLCLLINICVAAIVAVLVFMFAHSIARIYGNEQIARWLPFAPLSTFFLGINTILSAWAVRKKKFRLLSLNRVMTALLAPVFSIALGFMILGPVGLFVGLFISQVIPTIRMSYQIFKVDQLKMHFRKENMRSVFFKFRNYPLFSLPSEFINDLSNQFPVMMLSQAGGVQLVGWYNLSVRMLGLPTTLISTSIADVFRQRASYDYFSIGTCRPIFIKVFKTLTLLSIAPLVVILLFGPALFSFVFGARWEEAGVIAQILSILYAFKFIASPLSYVTYISNRQWIGLIIDVALLVMLFSIYYVATTYHLHYTTSLLMFSLSYSALYFLTFYMSYKYTVNEKFVEKA
jgi:O-antigen/teichoic acid export membrane protein